MIMHRRMVSKPTTGNQRLFNAVERLIQWAESREYEAYDPFDGLNAWLRPFAIGKLGRQLLVQGVKRFPWNLRPLLGIRPATSSKAMGYFARGFLKLYAITSESSYLDKAIDCLDWLRDHPCQGYSGLCWGNHFDYQQRTFYLPKAVPSVVWTAHIGHAFVDAYELLGDQSYLKDAYSVCEFVFHDLERQPEGTGVSISYIPTGYYAIHNANMLGASILARCEKHSGRGDWRRVAQDAVAYTIGAQRPDGSWWYGQANNLHWVDNFHTGYVLDSLWWYMESTGDRSHALAFERAAEFFTRHFFLDDGTPKFYPHRVWPVDIQCAAQAIETLTLLARALNSTLITLAQKVAHWTITYMQDADGYFYFQRWPWVTSKAPMLHWGQATMLHALACLLAEENEYEH